MIDRENRRLIMDKFGVAVDGLVRDLYSDAESGPSMVQEPEITARICQRVEDQLDGQPAGDYIFRVMAQSMPDRGPKSLERITGADIFLSVSLDGDEGFDKGIFIQAKYDRNIDRQKLLNDCEKMEQYVGKEGAYVWIYNPNGVKVLSTHQIHQMKGNTVEGLNSRSTAGFAGRVIDCYAGSQRWGIPTGVDRRQVVHERLRQVRAQNGLDVLLKQQRSR